MAGRRDFRSLHLEKGWRTQVALTAPVRLAGPLLVEEWSAHLRPEAPGDETRLGDWFGDMDVQDLRSGTGR